MNLKNHVQLLINIILIAAIIVIAFFQFNDKEKIAYVDNSILLGESDIGIKTVEELEAKIKEFQEEVKTRESEITVLKDLLEKDPGNITVSNELDIKTGEYNSYLGEVEKELNEYESGLLDPVYETINMAVEEYGKEHGYSIILGATGSGNIVYGEEALDLTRKVLEYMNRITEEED